MYVKDKVAIVTGGAMGIGFGISKELLKNGVKGGASLQSQFVNFSKFGDPNSDGKTITLSKNDAWMQQAQIIDGKVITIVDTGVCFNKFKSHSIDFPKFVAFLEDLAQTKGIEPEEIKEKLKNCGMPGSTPSGTGTPGEAATTPTS